MEWQDIWVTIGKWFEVKGLKFAVIVATMLLTLVAVRVIVGRVVAVYKNRHKERERQKRAGTLGTMFRYLFSLAVIFVGSMAILDLFDIRLGPMLAAAGVMGIAIGFGAQHLIQDITNGFFIMLDDEIRVGDVIKAGGEYGTVERVSLRQTVLRSIDGNVHFIPNSKIDVVTNLTKTYSYCMLDINVAYREDVDEVMEVMAGVVDAMRLEEPYSEWILEPLDVMGLDSFADAAMRIKARIKVQPIKQWRVKREFNRRLKKAFDERNIEIPFPHLTLYMGQDKQGCAPALHVALTRSAADVTHHDIS